MYRRVIVFADKLQMLFFSSRCERLCMIQFSLISLIPGLIQNLQDCADPALESYARNLVKPTSLRTSDRSSLLAYMGLPLQLFGKGSFFGPYTPLQQLDLLADYGTKSYIVGSTNSLLLQQRDKYSDILINLDDSSVNITSPSLRSALSLSAADRRWMDFLTQTVIDTWDPSIPSRPNTMGYIGSEEFIRLQFEEYLLALLSSVSYHQHLKSKPKAKPESNSTSDSTTNPTNSPPPTDPSTDFNEEFILKWSQTSNYALFHSITADSSLFDVVTPRHPTAGGLSVEDIQRRLAQQVSELHLDERMKEGREVLNKTLATGAKNFAVGRERVSEGLGKLWADIEAMREAQRKKAAAEKSLNLRTSDDPALATNVERPISSSGSDDAASNSPSSSKATRLSTIQQVWVQRTKDLKTPNVDMKDVHERAQAARAQAGAYISSWGSWVGERRKEMLEKRNHDASAGTVTGVDGGEKDDGGGAMAAGKNKENEKSSNSVT